MSKIQIVTDSTAYITEQYAKNNNIKIVPLIVNFNEKVTEEGYPGQFETFFNELKESKDFPKTSQPSVGAFSEVFKEAIDNGYEVIAITLSSILSGTYNSACVAREMVNPEKISVIDSENTVSNMKHLVQLIKELSDKGMERKDIVDRINKQKKNMGIRLTVDTLDYLQKGGRLSTTQAFIGSLLNIKPILGLVEGKLIPLDKVRGKKKAIQAMIDDIPEDVKRISICQILNLEEAEEIKTKINEKFNNIEITIEEIGPVIGSHLGLKGIGICYSW